MKFEFYHANEWVLISGPTWFDCRHWAMRVFGCAPGELSWCDGEREKRTDWELRWVGHDAGPVAMRRMQVRRRGGKWVDA